MLGLIATMGLTLALLFAILFGILAAVGTYFGASLWFIVILAIVIMGLQWLVGPSLIRATTNIRDLKKNELPWLHSTVEEICKKKKIPVPRLALARIGAPNAFVFGHTPFSATLAVTTGLLNTLNRDEIKGVIGHELGHIKHWDMVVMVIVAVIPMILYFIASNVFYSRERKGAAVLIGLLAFLAYFLTNLLVMALSRLREYYADAFSAKLLKPAWLASALAKITYGLAAAPSSERVKGSAANYFFIADSEAATAEIAHFAAQYADLHISKEEVQQAIEWEKRNWWVHLSELFRTHPLTYKRIAALHRLEK